MQKDEKIFVPIPEDQREKLTELLKAYQPQRNARKEIETLTAKYLNQTIGDVSYTQDEYLKDVEKICNKHKNKRPSPNANKKRNIDRDVQIVKDLQIYYDDDLPLRHNVKSYFIELADKHTISSRRIKQIAEENRPGSSSK